jgi:hypothetical protein
MKKHILFIQGAGEGAYKEDEKLVTSLRSLLGEKYKVHYPPMPDECMSDYKTLSREIEHELAALGGKVIVVGHLSKVADDIKKLYV